MAKYLKHKVKFLKVEIGYMQTLMVMVVEFSKSFLYVKHCSKCFACRNPFTLLNWGRNYYQLYYTDKETEAQNVFTCPS